MRYQYGFEVYHDQIDWLDKRIEELKKQLNDWNEAKAEEEVEKEILKYYEEGENENLYERV